MARRPTVTLSDDIFHDLDRNGPVPLYHQVARSLEDAIQSGRLEAGERLENEIALAERLYLSRPTIRRAIQELVDKGLLVRRRGIGTQVVRGPISRSVELTSLHDDLAKVGQAPGTELLDYAIEPAGEETAEYLAIAVGAPTLRLERIRYTGDTPLAVMENTLPERFTDIDRESLTSRGLYEIMRARGVVFSVAKQSIGARAATGREAALLSIADHSPLLTMHRVAYDNNGSAVEVGSHCYRPDLYSFETMLVDK